MTKYVNNNGVSEMWTNIKNYISAQLLGKSDVGHTHSASDITSGLATVATSGSYNDLSNKPTIPTVNNATLTIQKNGTNVQTFTANQSTNATANITVPTKTSDLTNDSGFITEDNTKIPLAGSNQISGDLIPSSNGTVNLGSSNYYWNNGYINKLYTKVQGVTAPYLVCIPMDYTFGTIPNETKQGLINLFTDANGAPNFRIYNSIYSSGDQAIFFYTYSIKNETNAFILSQSYSDNLLSVSAIYGDLGLSQRRWRNLFLVNAPNVSSDERVKQQIKSVDDDLIEIWENVKPKQYKLNSSVERKGENARIHIGYIVQDIQKACEEKGIDPTKYSMFCHDEWEEQEEKKDENGQVIEPYRPKGDLYSLRYEEALVVECAYLRKCIKELRNEIEELKKGNNVK